MEAGEGSRQGLEIDWGQIAQDLPCSAKEFSINPIQSGKLPNTLERVSCLCLESWTNIVILWGETG